MFSNNSLYVLLYTLTAETLLRIIDITHNDVVILKLFVFFIEGIVVFYVNSKW